MRSVVRRLGVLLLAAVACSGIVRATSDLNEVGALLVYPVILATNHDEWAWETFLTVTNASPNPITAHVAYINGDAEDPAYCFECDFDIPLTGNARTYDPWTSIWADADIKAGAVYLPAFKRSIVVRADR